MKKLSVIIPSRTTGNLIACATAVRMLDPEVEIIVVDDGVDLERVAVPIDIVVPGIKSFVFARNCNLGIDAAADNDVILLNDDALLQTPLGFSAMRATAEANPEYGLISSACNNVGNYNQHQRPGAQLRDEERMVCFTSVLIPRRTIDTVGLLDTRFVNYGLDDDDYCLRVRNAGLKIGIFDGCSVDHASLPSTYRGQGGGDFRANLEIFKDKWGMDNHGRPFLRKESNVSSRREA